MAARLTADRTGPAPSCPQHGTAMVDGDPTTHGWSCFHADHRGPHAAHDWTTTRRAVAYCRTCLAAPTRADVAAAEAQAAARFLPVDGDREGWRCASDGDDIACGTVRWIWTDPDTGASWPACDWHRAEAIHDAIPYGADCSRCGIDHAALWPSGEPLFATDEESLS